MKRWSCDISFPSNLDGPNLRKYILFGKPIFKVRSNFEFVNKVLFKGLSWMMHYMLCGGCQEGKLWGIFYSACPHYHMLSRMKNHYSKHKNELIRIVVTFPSCCLMHNIYLASVSHYILMISMRVLHPRWSSWIYW